MANAMRAPLDSTESATNVETDESVHLRPGVVLAIGVGLTIFAAGWCWMELRNTQSGPPEVYFGPSIGDVSNPHAGKLVTDGTNMVRVDKADDGQSIIITPIKTEKDRTDWLASQHDRPPAPVILPVSNETLLATIDGATTTFTAADDKAARQKSRIQGAFHDKAVAASWLRMGGISAVSLTVLGIGIYSAVRRR